MFVTGLTAMAYGTVPAATVAVAMFVAPSITVTLALLELATYIWFVTGLTATACGALPAATVAVTYCARTGDGPSVANRNPLTDRNVSTRLRFPGRLEPNSSE